MRFRHRSAGHLRRLPTGSGWSRCRDGRTAFAVGLEFAEAVVAETRVKYPSLAPDPDDTSIISARHRARLIGAIDEARSCGARILSLADDGPEKLRKIPLAVIIDARLNSLLLREVIFGSILLVVGDYTLDGVAEYINTHNRSLALYALSKDSRRLEAVLDQSISGGVTLNGSMLHAGQEGMAFGGVGANGMGGYHGHGGFRRFNLAPSVHKIGLLMCLKKLDPPRGPCCACGKIFRQVALSEAAGPSRGSGRHFQVSVTMSNGETP